MRGFNWLLVLIFVFANSMSFADTVNEWDIQALKLEGQKQGWTFDVGENWVTDYLKRGGNIKEITGLVKPEFADKNEKYINLPVEEELPAEFDWRAEVPGGLTPIKNQGQCGSCWAFSVLGVVESILKIKNPEQDTDLAEQTLVSSCSNSGSCSGGYFSAFNYVKSPGIPDESQDPYKAANTSCRRLLTPAAKILNWAYIGTSGKSPTTEQMKTAIKNYGPISVTVNASFGSYSSGIFNRCAPNSTDHMVNLIGWNDEGKYWIMRNSWGTNWGEDGYMKILYKDSRGYKCNNIGQVAAFATLANDDEPQP